MADNVIIVEPGDERAQKIARAISSQTAGEVLSLMRESPHTSTELARHLNIPLTTVQYHLENLVDAGMVSIVEKRWSRKGREIKVYGLRNQLLIVAPRVGDVRSLLLKYASLFCIFIMAGVVMTLLFSLTAIQSAPSDFLEKTASGDEAVRAGNTLAHNGGGGDYLPVLLFFFTGGSLIALMLTARELWHWYCQYRVLSSPDVTED